MCIYYTDQHIKIAEILKANFKQPKDQRTRKLKDTWKQINIKTQHAKSCDTKTAVKRGKYITTNAYIKSIYLVSKF